MTCHGRRVHATPHTAHPHAKGTPVTADTKAALEAALNAHIAALTEGDIVTDWTLIAATTTVENIGTGTTRYWCEGNDHQPLHVTIGLLQYARDTATWGDDEDDD